MLKNSVLGIARAGIAAVALAVLAQPAFAAQWKLEFGGTGTTSNGSGHSFVAGAKDIPMSGYYIFDDQVDSAQQQFANGTLEYQFDINGVPFVPVFYPYSGGIFTYSEAMGTPAEPLYNFQFVTSTQESNGGLYAQNEVHVFSWVRTPDGSPSSGSVPLHSFSYTTADFWSDEPAFLSYWGWSETDGYEQFTLWLDRLSLSPVDDTPAAAVPEPASWALMIGGLGAIGASMRRRAHKARLRFAIA